MISSGATYTVVYNDGFEITGMLGKQSSTHYELAPVSGPTQFIPVQNVRCLIPNDGNEFWMRVVILDSPEDEEEFEEEPEEEV